MSKSPNELYAASLQEYLQGERQWTRPCRITHARLRLDTAAPAEKQFWRDILAANGAEVDQ